MKAVFYLENCTSCQKILTEWALPDTVQHIEVKTQPITEQQLDKMYARSGSYEALFSKRARLYQERNLKNQTLTEVDYKKLILEHYTFLKRPVLIWDDQISMGNSKKTVAMARQWIHGLEEN